MEPGWPFLAGWQDRSYALNAFQRGILTTDQTLNNPMAMNNTERFTARMNIEPFNGLKIDLTANRMYASNYTEYFTANARWQLAGGRYARQGSEWQFQHVLYFSENRF